MEVKHRVKKDDAFNLIGELGAWLSIALVTLVRLAIAYTGDHQLKSEKLHAGIKFLRDGSSSPDLTVEESDIGLTSATSATLLHESQRQAYPEESRIASQGNKIMYTSAQMALPCLP